MRKREKAAEKAKKELVHVYYFVEIKKWIVMKHLVDIAQRS